MRQTTFSNLCLTLSLTAMLFIGCSKCPSETEISPELVFKTSALSISGMLSLNELNFIDRAGEEYKYVATESFQGVDKIFQTTGRFECENGDKSDGFYLSERQFKRYEYLEGNSIELTIFSWNSQLVLNDSEIASDGSVGRDIFLAELVLNGCDTIRESRFLDLANGNSNVFSNDIPHIKHDQVHDSIFSVGVLSYPGNMIFSYDKGLVSFNYCNFNLVQKED